VAHALPSKHRAGYLPSKHRALSSNPSAVRKEESVLCVLRTRTGLFQMITGKYNIFSLGSDFFFGGAGFELRALYLGGRRSVT
jgi:hypothetical protein